MRSPRDGVVAQLVITLIFITCQFAVFRGIEGLDSGVKYCHLVAHILDKPCRQPPWRE